MLGDLKLFVSRGSFYVNVTVLMPPSECSFGSKVICTGYSTNHDVKFTDMRLTKKRRQTFAFLHFWTMYDFKVYPVCDVNTVSKDYYYEVMEEQPGREYRAWQPQR